MVNDREDPLAFYAAQEAVEMARVAAARSDEAAATARRVEAEARLAAIRLLMGKPQTPAPQTVTPSPTPAPNIPQPEPSSATETWPEVVEGLLKDRVGGLTAQEMVALLNATWAEKYKRQPNGFYNTLNRLHKTERIGRMGKRYYDATIYEMLRGGVLEPAKDPSRDRMPDLINEVLRDAEGPLPAAEIIARLRTYPGVSERLGPLGNLAYTHLSKLSRSGGLTRVPQGYDLPERAATTPPSPENVTLFPTAKG